MEMERRWILETLNCWVFGVSNRDDYLPVEIRFYTFVFMMAVYQGYLEKSGLYPAWIEEAPSAALGLCVVIPAYHEQELLSTLASLQACHAIERPTEIIVVLNDKEGDEPAVVAFHEAQYKSLSAWCSEHSKDRLKYHMIYAKALPKKKAGVGMARKLGMDEAIRRFAKVSQTGIIVALDGDTMVAENYLQAIDRHFAAHPKHHGASIRYAHRLEGLAAAQLRAIIQYELHLRIFLAAKRWTGFPFAYETIGSAMAVRSEAYCKQGGMNTRKAGEDFYFLNKFIQLGNFGEINDTCVLPSSRISERVPFGTGRAMQDILSSGADWKTYPPTAFLPLRDLFGNVESLYEHGASNVADPILKAYLEKEGFEKIVAEIKSNTASPAAFEKRFFRWFDAFRLMKYLHFALDQGAEKVEVSEAGKWIWQEVYGESAWPAGSGVVQEQWLLEQLRERSERKLQAL